MKVVVTDGNERSALAAVRSLGRAGHQVAVCSSSDRSLAGASRFAEASHRVPDPLRDPAGFVDALAAICADEDTDVLLPMTDAALEAILPSSSRFGDVVIPVAGLETYRSISDKRDLMARARHLGIPTPAEVAINHLDEVEGHLDALRFPVVLKPARSVVKSGSGRHKVSVTYAESARTLLVALRQYPSEAFPILLQEFIPGWGEGAFFLFSEGEPVARFAHRRIRERPPSGGVSVYREAIRLPADIEQYSTDLLKSYGWTGVAMVEFRRSDRDGSAYLMEVNGRFWGSLQLAVDAGVDFPSLLVEQCRSGPTQGPSEYRYGVRSRWWIGELEHVLLRLKGAGRGPPVPLPSNSGSLPAAIARLIIPWWPGDRAEVMRLTDPFPGMLELARWFSEPLHKRIHGR